MRYTAHALRGLSSLALLAGAAGCADRAEIWDLGPPDDIEAYGLADATAVIDGPAKRALVLTVDQQLELAATSIPIGDGFAAAATTPDGERLLVLSRGVVPRLTAEDAGPQLLSIAGGSTPAVAHAYPLSDPLSGLSVDPESEIAVVYAGEADTSFVQNPNELVLIDLAKGPGSDNPYPRTLRSFGGRPQALTFTPELDLPGGARRLLVVQTEQDVALIGLDDLSVPEITIPLTAASQSLTPGGIAVSDGDPESSDDSRIAVRIQSDPNVIVVDLLPLPQGEEGTTPQTFRATPNVVYVGGIPTDIEFVNTDGGLRLAALVPNQQALTLIDPATGIASQIEIGQPLGSMSLITPIVGETDAGSDVALLWSSSSPYIAFVALGATVGKPYKSVELIKLPDPVDTVYDVPSPNEHLKILRSTDGRTLVVLDLLQRTATPITASSADTQVALSPDGQRAWISQASDIALLDLASLHPMNLLLAHRIDSVYDIARLGGGRALVALHPLTALGATVLDAEAPSLAGSREYVGLLLGGLP